MASPGRNRVRINGITFPTRSFVRLTNIAVPPNPVVFGDTNQAGNSAAMIQLIQSSWTGGQGVYRGNSRTDTERFFDSELWTVNRDTLCLPRLAYRTGWPHAGGQSCAFIGEFRNTVYAGIGNEVYSWDDTGVGYTATAVGSTYEHVKTSGTGWSLSRTLPLGAIVSDGISWGGNLFIGWKTGHSYRTSAGVWTDVAATDIYYFSVLDDVLYGIALNTGTSLWELKFTPDGTTWTTPATAVILAPDFTVTDLTTFRDAAGNQQLWAITDGVPYIYDQPNARFKAAELDLPRTGAGSVNKAVVWRDSRLYQMTGGAGAVAIQAGNPLVVTPIGLDRDDGTPTVQSFRDLARDTNFIYARVRDTANKQWIKAFNGSGWHTFWTSAQVDTFGVGVDDRALAVATHQSNYRLWWAHNRQLYFMDLDTDIHNPRILTSRNYAYGPLSHITPWWEYGSGIQHKVHGHILAVTRDVAGLNALVQYQTDFNESSWTNFGTGVLANGLIDLSPGAAGIQCRWIRFKITLTRETANITDSPIIEVFTSEVMRVLPPTFAFGLELDLTSKAPVGGLVMDELVNQLKRLCNPQVVSGFYPLEYRDSLKYDHVHYGRVARINGQEATPEAVVGQGIYLISFISPYSTD
jgi:hypothetical protein